EPRMASRVGYLRPTKWPSHGPGRLLGPTRAYAHPHSSDGPRGGGVAGVGAARSRPCLSDEDVIAGADHSASMTPRGHVRRASVRWDNPLDKPDPLHSTLCRVNGPFFAGLSPLRLFLRITVHVTKQVVKGRMLRYSRSRQ